MSYHILDVSTDGMLTYKYGEKNGDGYAFNTFCEVGAPYQPKFKRMLKRAGYRVETRELDAAPWVADFVRDSK